MDTKLDNLFALLGKDSSLAARKAAASQIGEVQKSHPYDLQNLLERAHHYLRSIHWDTRIASSQAIEAIVTHVPRWPDRIKSEQDTNDKSLENEASTKADIKPDVSSLDGVKSDEVNSGYRDIGRFTFEKFNIKLVMNSGKQLLASEGLEFERSVVALSPQQLAEQRKLLISELNLGDDSESLIADEDLIAGVKTSTTQQTSSKSNLSQNEQNQQMDIVVQLESKATSSRMRNKAKRAMKENPSQVPSFSASNAMKTKTVMTDQPKNDDKLVVESVVDVDRAFEDINEWPLERFCDELCNELFDKRWQIRHGAALGLREILKKHCESAGKRKDMNDIDNERSNRSWFVDCSIRLICVLVLDRFADFSDDAPVAHVREACSQVLAVIMSKMIDEDLDQILQLIITLIQESDFWEVRHSGFLALKYLVAVRPQFAQSRLDRIIPCLFEGLDDLENDVKAVAADAMNPLISQKLKKSIQISATETQISLKQDPSLPVESNPPNQYDQLLNTETCTKLLSVLSNILVELDDISSATNNAMILLSSLCNLLGENPGVVSTLDPTALFPRLWPFFRHAIRSVRSSVLNVISTLLISESHSKHNWLPSISTMLFQLLLQNFLLEEDPAIVQMTFSTWINLLIQCSDVQIEMPVQVQLEDGSIVEQAQLASLISASVPIDTLLQWFKLFSSEFDRPIPRTSLVHVPFHGQVDPSFSSVGVSDRKVVDAKCYDNLSTALSWLITISPEFTDYFVQFINAMITGLKGSERIAAGMLTSKWSKIVQLKKTLNEKLIEAVSSATSTIHVTDGQEGDQPTTQIDFIKYNESLKDILASISADSVHLLSKKFTDDPISLGLPETLWNLFVSAAAVQFEPEFYFAETNNLIISMRKDCQLLINTLNENAVKVDLGTSTDQLSVDQAKELFSKTFDTLLTHVKDVPSVVGQSTPRQILKGIQIKAQANIDYLESIQHLLTITTSSWIASALIYMLKVPPKLNDAIKPLLRALNKQSDSMLQMDAADALATLIKVVNQTNPRPSQMVISKVVACLWADPATIQALNFAKEIEESVLNASSSSNPKKRKASTKKDEDVSSEDEEKVEIDDVKPNKKTKAKEDKPDSSNEPSTTQDQTDTEKALGKRGSEFFMIRLCSIFEENLFVELPSFWNSIFEPLETAYKSNIENETALTISLLIISTISGYVHSKLKDKMLSLVELIVYRLSSPEMKIRALAAQAISSIVKHTVPYSMNIIVKHLLPLLQDASNVDSRRGAALALHCIIDSLEIDVLPYLIFLIVPVLGRMSDQDDIVRKTMSHSFASLVKLMPLEAQVPNPKDMPIELVEQRAKERSFLDQLLGGKKIDPYELPIRINTELRAYQQEGVNWLAFLNKYNLHGILADDMGLGKTLQTICIISSDNHYRAEQYAKTKSLEFKPLPGLVVCPPILVPHWENEVKRFCDSSIKVVQYKGNPSERAAIRNQANQYQIIVMSYEVLRNDVEPLSSINFNYCVLDEGHIIRNAKTKVTQAVKKIRANHRLILTGTPIQNNVLELWSLFDFLMPGFLGTEKQFMATYSKPVMASRDAKASSKEQEQGMMALEALHRQALPFILRRMKEDVLHDLPPKIIQDVNVDLSALQTKLYVEFSKNNSPSSEEGESKHVFQALQYLRKLVSHPKLVISPKHPKYSSIIGDLRDNGQTLDDYTHSPKLIALKELLLGCGIGHEKTDFSAMDSGITQNRVLIFTQLKQMLDIVENDLFKKHMPNVSYLRLDGDVPQGSRMPIVEKFNSNPSIDVLLLTVSVGGLGLNLTGANTVIFLEHDWNPQNDIQAMDRVHRIGQKKTVNVYRLITRGTLEEKIMGLQRFKLQIANTIVNKENQSFQSMDTSQLLDLFNYTNEADKKSSSGVQGVDEFGNVISTSSAQQKGLKGILDSLEELGDESRYAEEYNLDNLLSTLK